MLKPSELSSTNRWFLVSPGKHNIKNSFIETLSLQTSQLKRRMTCEQPIPLPPSCLEPIVAQPAKWKLIPSHLFLALDTGLQTAALESYSVAELIQHYQEVFGPFSPVLLGRLWLVVNLGSVLSHCLSPSPPPKHYATSSVHAVEALVCLAHLTGNILQT